MKQPMTASLSIGNLAEEDDFDRWVAGRIESVSTATAASQQYTGSSNYVPGFAIYTPMAPFPTVVLMIRLEALRRGIWLVPIH